MAVGIEEVLLNVNGQDNIYYVLTEDGLHVTEIGYFDSYDDCLYSDDYAIARHRHDEADRLLDELEEHFIA